MNLKSTNIESHLFVKLLKFLIDAGVLVKEICTDANTQIISVMSKLYNDVRVHAVRGVPICFLILLGKRAAFSSIFHSLDVWHKAAKLTAQLAKVPYYYS